MANNWTNHQPAELEYFHSKLHEEFHKFRKQKALPGATIVLMDGVEFNRIVAAAKIATYKKYTYLGSVGIPNEVFDEKLKQKGDHGHG